jgi:hypothetical protein
VATRKQIEKIVPFRLDYARRLYSSGYYSDALHILFELQKYPVGDTQTINNMICEAYMGQAEGLFKTAKLFRGRTTFPHCYSV